MDLQAQLYQTQDTVRHSKETGYTGQRGHVGRLKPAAEKKNSGVEERDQRDRLHLKSTTTNRASECYAALERKAALYDKLARGEAGDDDETYEVDFLSKSYEQHQQQRQQQGDGEYTDLSVDQGEGEPGGGLEGYQRHDRDLEAQQEEEEEEARRQHREVILGLAQDTKDSRQRALQLKELKEKQAQDKANALKEAYLKKQLSKAMAKGGPAAKGKGKAAAGKQAPQ
ncbi:hypothetical protein DUNSADRAFT_7516 [Dunaliella salina]|uniref:Casein kinase substrate phosphoprotein PP28 domain-containing protein n=1 Tax=Dunaliella salina TaxID=3046 RepID=A0ABQ7FT90_DUNSA|nr:hypothetical protein DUNSADRAFT_7516 [Dunaliella salina]|eukprot:KAF5825695.1 hypothetical protein DUNSADRAFT_7516 [Dunaliella salina]